MKNYGIEIVTISLATFAFFWSLTFIEQKNNLSSLRKDFEKEKEENVAFRHEYKGVTKNLFQHIDNEVKLILITIKGIAESIKGLKK